MLEIDGWEVFRTAGSHGSADLVAVDTATRMHDSLERQSLLNIVGSGYKLARLVQIKTCQEKDVTKYEKEKVPGVELWIKVMNRGWQKYQ